jgi:hypothetical protein
MAQTERCGNVLISLITSIIREPEGLVKQKREKIGLFRSFFAAGFAGTAIFRHFPQSMPAKRVFAAHLTEALRLIAATYGSA